ncbi:ATP-binding protein [Carboxylicivirga sp. RSCT41]|uniref:sensor histidine kinase n=1 Tax=Carboxylicivirga agarovorans TaxID=3417570 RepID=UPI003D337F88
MKTQSIQSLLDSIDEGVLCINYAGQVIASNGRIEALLGLCDEELFKNSHMQYLQQELEAHRQQNITHFEVAITKEDHTLHIFKCIINAYEVLVLYKPTETIEADSLSAILEGQENERRRLGREIHDSIGPLMSFIRLNLDAVIEKIHDNTVMQHPELIESISETVDSVTSDLRALSHRLVPRTLDEFGLYSAFNSLAYKLNHSKRVNIEFYSNMDVDVRFDNELELNLYRCGQELLYNAIRHARAKQILIQIIRHKESIILMVEDDGVGFSKEVKDANHGIGLTNIETRTKLLNGVFSLDSVPEKGTVASIEIPLN